METRSDLDIPTGTLSSEKNPTDKMTETAAQTLLSGLEYILEYDHEKKVILSQLDQVRARILELEEDIAGWIQDESADLLESLHLTGDEHEVTLADARIILEQVTVKQHQLESRRSQLRELSLNRIATLTGRLREFGPTTDMIVSDDLTLDELASDDITNWASPRLWTLEQTLVKLVDEQTMKVQSIAPEKLVTELKSDWNDGKLVDLLNRLAEDKRDVETLLLLLTANAAHPSSLSERRLPSEPDLR